MGMPSIAFSTLFSLDREQPTNLSSDRSLPSPVITSTPVMENGLRTSVKGQPDDQYPPSDHKLFSPPDFSDALIAGHLPPKSETSAIPPLQLDPQGQIQYGLRAGLEKGKEVTVAPHAQQPDSDEEFNMTTIKILCEPGGGSEQITRTARALLDTAADCNMVSRDMVTEYLCMSTRIQVQDERSVKPIMTLNGDEVTSHNKIELVFYGKGGMNRRTYRETFLVIDGDPPCEIILGKHFLQDRGVYKRIGLVGVHPRKTEAELREAPARQRRHDVERAENEKMVREQEAKERTTSLSAQKQRNGIFSNPSRHQDRP